MVDVSADGLVGSGGGGSFVPQRTNNFTLEIDKLAGSELAIQSITFPSFSTERGEVNYQNEKRYFILGFEFEEVTVTLRDMIDTDIAKKVYNWFKEGADPETGKIGNPADYKTDITLMTHDPKGQNERSWKYIGTYIESWNGGDLDYETKEIVLLDITLSVDKITPA